MKPFFLTAALLIFSAIGTKAQVSEVNTTEQKNPLTEDYAFASATDTVFLSSATSQPAVDQKQEAQVSIQPAEAQYETPSAVWKDQMALNAPQLYQKYKSASNLSGIGMGLTIGGAIAMIVGFATADIGEVTPAVGIDGANVDVVVSGPGAPIVIVGTLCAGIGVCMWHIGHTNKKKIRNTYFEEYGNSACTSTPTYLQLRSTSNGLGLAYVF